MKIVIEKSTNKIVSFAKGDKTDFSGIDKLLYDVKILKGTSLPSSVGTCKLVKDKIVVDVKFVAEDKKLLEQAKLLEKTKSEILERQAKKELGII